MPAIIECVPNFSEGRDQRIILAITDAIESVENIRLLNVDPGKATNRTVVTFVGSPEAVIEAAFRGIQKAGELIDMRGHQGAHPRMGATDVCPLIPVSGISMEETVAWAQELAARVGKELQIPVYLYEAAQSDTKRNSLSVIRAGEYEGFSEKIVKTGWKPDYGPAVFDVVRGATVIGARDFLVAYNVNLNTTSVRRANSIAFDVREAGRVKREGDLVSGPVVKDSNGKPVSIPGTLKSVKAIGWFIEEYGVAQISMNLTNLSVTPLHIAFDEVCSKAAARGMRVTGSELVGLVPLHAMLDAGRYFLAKQQRSTGVAEKELIRIAILTMGLDELAPFKPEERIIEYLLAAKEDGRLVSHSLSDFADLTASESAAPGGGSVAAYTGALAASLGGMVANLSAHKKGWDARWKFFSDWADEAQAMKKELLMLVDADAAAFTGVMEAFALPKQNEAEKIRRTAALESATLQAIRVPFQVMTCTASSLGMLRAMAESGNPNSISDAGVGVLCARAAIHGAYLNVRINAGEYEYLEEVKSMMQQGNDLRELTDKMEKEIMAIVDTKIKS